MRAGRKRADGDRRGRADQAGCAQHGGAIVERDDAADGRARYVEATVAVRVSVWP